MKFQQISTILTTERITVTNFSIYKVFEELIQIVKIMDN